jgi:MFS family permease
MEFAVKSSLARAHGALAGRSQRTVSTSGALAALSLAVLLSSLGTSIANVALPTLANAFDVPFQAVQWIVLAYLLATTTLSVSGGRLGDLAGRRRVLSAGLVLLMAASALCAAASTFPLLVAARAMQGAGAAVMLALAMASVGDTVAKTRTGSAMGLLGTMSAIGTALGPSLGGGLIATLGWRAIFLINLPLGLVALVLVRRYLPDRGRERTAADAGFDRAGTLALAIALSAYALALTVGGIDGAGIALLAAAGGAMVIFVLVERRAPAPLISPATLRDRRLNARLAASALVSTVVMATLVVGPFYLSRALGLDAAIVGLTMSVGPVAVALAGVPAGRMVDRFGPRRITLAGLAAMAGGAALLAALPSASGIAGYVAPLVVLTVGYAAFQTANNTEVMTDVPAERRGAIAGLLNLARNLGLITGASAMGAVFARATGDVTTASVPAVAGGLRVTFAVAAGLGVAALALTATDARRGPPASVTR